MFNNQTVGGIVTAEGVENYKTFNNLIVILTNYQRHAALLTTFLGGAILCKNLEAERIDGSYN